MRKYLNAIFRFIEAGAVGWFFIQAVRFLITTLFAHASGAEIAARLYGPNPPPGVLPPRTITTETLTLEVVAVAVAVLAPLAALVLGRWSLGPTVAAGVAAAARVMMINEEPVVQVVSAAVVLGAGALYFTFVARQDAEFFPVGLVVGLTLDQVVRALGDTRDLTLDPDFLAPQTVISLLALGVAALAWITRAAPEAGGFPATSEDDDDERAAEATARAEREGIITLWGGVAFGALLFLQLALLGLPNAAARWTNISYAILLPWVVVATALPLLPAVRGAARGFIGIFDGAFRGWVWFLLIGLCLVMGTRLGGLLGAVGMVLGQFFAVLALWWVVEPARAGAEAGAPARRPARERRFHVAGLGMVAAAVTLALLVVGNLFTFVYGATTVALVTAFRGMGWVIFVAAALLACLPIILARTRIPWRGGSGWLSLAATLFVAGAALTALVATQPVVAPTVQDANQLRIATYNIHSGYSALYTPELEEIANVIERTSVDIVLLQEVDTGRLTSNGVDQAWWLARRLRMEVAYYPTNEAVHGLAVLSRVRMLDAAGSPLTSKGEQTSVQRVHVCTVSASPCPDEHTIDVYNTWLGRPERDVQPQDMDQWTQLEEVLRWVGVNMVGREDPWVAVGGTFNATPDSLLYDQMIAYDFVDPFANALLPEDQLLTYCPGECLARFDYVWLRNLTPQVAAVIASDASDHRMAVVEVGVRRAAD